MFEEAAKAKMQNKQSGGFQTLILLTKENTDEGGGSKCSQSRSSRCGGIYTTAEDTVAGPARPGYQVPYSSHFF